MAATHLAATRTRVAMVQPPYGVVSSGVADMHIHRDNGSELVDQAHHGEFVHILGESGAWRYVQGVDHYFGWIAASDLDDGEFMRSVVPTWVVSVPLAVVREQPDPASRAIGQVALGTWVKHQDQPKDRPEGWLYLRYLKGWLSQGDVTHERDLPVRYPTPDDLIATAEAFLGVPYLWGGTTALGMDCSGFVQQVYGLNGVRLDRDAHQQAVEGRPVDVPARGDLVFFGQRSVTHVGIAVNERRMLSALGSARKVQADDIDGIGVGVLASRRYLP